MAENPDETDYNYAIEDCETIVGDLSDEGWEVGLHGGHTTYNNPDKLKEKKQRLEKVLNKNVVGLPESFSSVSDSGHLEILQSAGFHYDSTLGYADCIGFRNGMCHPFKPYNIKTKPRDRNI